MLENEKVHFSLALDCRLPRSFSPALAYCLICVAWSASSGLSSVVLSVHDCTC
jgi:hypothetical protein